MKIAKKSTRETVYEALVDCFNNTRRDVTPAQLIAITGFNKFMVNDNLELLIHEDQTVIRMTRGYFQPVLRFPDTRAITRTILPSGMNKVEIGDLILDLTPAEGRRFAALFGATDAMHDLDTAQQNKVQMASFSAENKKMRDQLSDLCAFMREKAALPEPLAAAM